VSFSDSSLLWERNAGPKNDRLFLRKLCVKNLFTAAFSGAVLLDRGEMVSGFHMTSSGDVFLSALLLASSSQFCCTLFALFLFFWLIAFYGPVSSNGYFRNAHRWNDVA